MKTRPTISRRNLLRAGAALVGTGAIGFNSFSREAHAAGKNLDTVKVITSGGDLSGTLQAMMKDQGFGEQLNLAIEYILACSEGSKINAELCDGRVIYAHGAKILQVSGDEKSGFISKFVEECETLQLVLVLSQTGCQQRQRSAW